MNHKNPFVRASYKTFVPEELAAEMGLASGITLHVTIFPEQEGGDGKLVILSTGLLATAGFGLAKTDRNYATLTENIVHEMNRVLQFSRSAAISWQWTIPQFTWAHLEFVGAGIATALQKGIDISPPPPWLQLDWVVCMPEKDCTELGVALPKDAIHTPFGVVIWDTNWDLSLQRKFGH